MKTLNKPFVLFLFVSLIFPVSLLSQTFENFDKSVLVDIPGDNYDFDLLSDGVLYPVDDLYITWVNKTDSVYTIYLKQITLSANESNIVISSDNIVKSNPQIALNSSGPGITIVWENYSGSYYQIVRRDYDNDSLSNKVIFKDSLDDDPQVTMNYNHLAWLMNGNLYFNELYPDTSSIVLLDSSTCYSPSLITDPTWFVNEALIYEKLVNGNHNIYLAEYQNYPNPHWAYSELSDGDNREPEFGAGGGISFERTFNGISRIKYFPWYDPQPSFLITTNTGCNFNNPDVFSYPMVTNQPDTPFFIVFDTDSIENNNEVMIQTFFFGNDQFINLSDMEGDDLKPKADVMNIAGVDYLVIVWEHKDNIDSSIWMATTIYQPAGGVKEDVLNLNSFELLQNYPNPFNPATNIEYSLNQGADVTVTVYDMLGNEIRTLANGYKAAGSYRVVFDGASLSSGVYFYSIEVNGLRKTRSMVLLR